MSQLPPENNQNNISPTQAKKALWKKGILNWKLDANQESIYNSLKQNNQKIDVMLCSRQMGKSFLLCLIAIEYCMQNPNVYVKMIAPQVQMIKNILRPNMREILIDCPEELHPKNLNAANNHIIKFNNGSEIQLAGTDNGSSDSLRGTKAHLCIVDEAGFCSELEYLIKDILIPTTTTTNGRIILSSTPPKTNDHHFCKFWDKAEMDGTLIKRTIYDNPRLSEQTISDLAEGCGGKDSVSFRREYLCEKIVSEEDAVIPEFTSKVQEKIIKEWPRPPFYDAYTCMDLGFNDLTVVLFAYYDFKNAKVVIEDELVENGRTLLSQTFGKAILDKEEMLWRNPKTGDSRKPHLRISDNNNPQFLSQLYNDHKISFMPTYKLEAEASLNAVRQMIKSGQIIINPRCKILISHLKNAIWNKSRTSFQRSADNGHFDAIDSLKYLCKNIDLGKNPYPSNYQFTNVEDVFFTKDNKTGNQFNDALVEMFKVKNPRRINK